MARPRKFDEEEVLTKAKEIFAEQGYNGTSIDDLVRATGLLRGSLYKAFGSKRNLFEVVFAKVAADFVATEQNLDLLTVALKDLASSDKAIRSHCRQIASGASNSLASTLGKNLLAKMKEK